MAHTEPPAVKTDPRDRHALAYAHFQKVIRLLKTDGWHYERIDTLVRDDADPRDRGQLTIRHHYDHGVWELTLEPNRYWDKAAKPIRIVRIDREKRLGPASKVVIELLTGHATTGIMAVAA